MTGHGEPNASGDITGPVPISPMESKGNDIQRVYHAHGTLMPFMSELVISLSSSQHSSRILGKKGVSVRLRW